MINRRNQPYGLTAEQVRIRQTLHGKNNWDRVHTNKVLYRCWRAFRTPGPLLLTATACISLLLETFTMAGVLFAAAVLYSCAAPVLAYHAEHAALLRHGTQDPEVTVIREGNEQRVPKRDLVPGDLVLLSEGMTVPADGMLLRADGLSTDESALPWENKEITKAASSDETSGDCCYAGSQILKGRGLLRVEQTGGDTVYAQNLHLPEPTAMQKQTREFLRVCLGIAAVAFLVAFALAFWRQEGVERRVLWSVWFGTAAAIAALPMEGPLLQAAIFSQYAERLHKEKTPVGSLAAVEKLGAITTLCVDQTDCCFADRTAVRALWALDGNTQGLYEILKEEDEATLSYFLPNGCKLSGQWKCLNEQETMVITGTAAELLPFCALAKSEEETVLQRETELEKRGLQVAAYAAADGKENSEKQPLHLMGLIAFAPLQGNSEQELAACRLAGLHTVRLREAAGSGEPEHGAFYCASFLEKRRVVEALKAGGECTAVVGCGAAALKNADLRIAVSGQGNEASWENADIVLLDGRLSAFADAVQEGRRACQAARRAVGLLKVVHIPLLLSALIFPLFSGSILPLLSIVLLECVTGAVCLLTATNRVRKEKSRILRGVSLWVASFGAFLAVLWQNPGNVPLAYSVWFAVLLFSIFFLSLPGGMNRPGAWIAVTGTLLALAFFFCTPLCQVIGLIPLHDGQLLLAALSAMAASFWQDWVGNTKKGGEWS